MDDSIRPSLGLSCALGYAVAVVVEDYRLVLDVILDGSTGTEKCSPYASSPVGMGRRAADYCCFINGRLCC